MVFRNGGRLSNREKWTFQGQQIELRTQYTYLGVTLTPKMSFTKHLENRNNSAKASINSTWGSYFANDKISLQAKYKMYQAVCRSIQGYAAQVWGYSMFELVDKLQLYFLKRIFKLPCNTPSYAVMLETGLENSYLYTLELHLRYIHKALFIFNENRLPNQLARKLLQENIGCAEKLNELGNEFQLVWTAEMNSTEWQEQSNQLLSLLKSKNSTNMWQRALGSETRIYKHLDHSIGPHYFKQNYSRSKIMYIFKARSGTIYLNGFHGRNCTLCNLNEIEDTQHFFGRCPILKRIRRRHLGKEFLNEEEVLNILNGVNDPDWNNLVDFITGALNYRQLIINEFI